MDWAKLGELSVGLAAATIILWIVLVKAKTNGNGYKSAGLTAGEWKTAINFEVKRALEETAAQRHEDLKRVFREVLQREFLERDNQLRRLIHDELERWEKE